MQVWTVLHAARCKCRTQKIARNSPSGHHRTTLLGYIFATKAHIDNRKKRVKQQYLPHMSPQYGELRPTSGWDMLASLGNPSKSQRVSRLGNVTARHSSSGRQPNFAALSRRRRLYSAGRPSRWALAHIIVSNALAFASASPKANMQLPPYFDHCCWELHRNKHVTTNCEVCRVEESELNQLTYPSPDIPLTAVSKCNFS